MTAPNPIEAFTGCPRCQGGRGLLCAECFDSQIPYAGFGFYKRKHPKFSYKRDIEARPSNSYRKDYLH